MLRIQEVAQAEQGAQHRHVDPVPFLQGDADRVDYRNRAARKAKLFLQTRRIGRGIDQYQAVRVDSVRDMDRFRKGFVKYADNMRPFDRSRIPDAGLGLAEADMRFNGRSFLLRP